VTTLKSWRSKGEQRVVVQHVNVSDGSQAVIGNITALPRGVGEKQDVQPHGLIGYAPGAEMLRPIEADKETVPSPSNEGEVDLLHARR